MIQNERFSRIYEFLKNNKTAKLKDIAQLNGVSIDTVRRDFALMEEAGMLRRVRGGAIFHNTDITTQTVDIRKETNQGEKREIASLLEGIICDGQAIALNSGTTSVEIAKFLVQNYNRLTVITNNLRAVDILSQEKGFTVIFPGGEVDGKEGAVFGDICEENILNYNIDVAVFGIHAISLEKGVTDFRINQKAIIQAMMKTAKKKIVAADSSKFEKVAYVNVCGLDEIDILLSDVGLSPEIRRAYEDRGMTILTP